MRTDGIRSYILITFLAIWPLLKRSITYLFLKNRIRQIFFFFFCKKSLQKYIQFVPLISAVTSSVAAITKDNQNVNLFPLQCNEINLSLRKNDKLCGICFCNKIIKQCDIVMKNTSLRIEQKKKDIQRRNEIKKVKTKKKKKTPNPEKNAITRKRRGCNQGVATFLLTLAK